MCPSHWLRIVRFRAPEYWQRGALREAAHARMRHRTGDSGLAAPAPDRPIRALLFDVYGTLVHVLRPTHPYRQLLGIVRARDPSIDRPAFSRLVMTRPLGLADAARLHAVESSAVQALEQELEREIASIELFPEVPQVLGTLRDRGYRIGVCSNLALPYASSVARMLEGLVDVAVWSFEAGYIKPEPQIYGLAAERLKVPPSSVLMVGDSYRADVEGPRAAGMQAVHLVRRGGGGDIGTLDRLLDWLP